MKRKLRRVFYLSIVLLMLPMATIAKDTKSVSKKVDWNPIMEAIIQVESEGNPRAISGQSCGAMQITPILVKDCNKILKMRNSKKRYTLADRFSVSKSKEMFLLIQSHYNPTNNIEQAIRSWYGGRDYSVRTTQQYYNKVLRHLK